MPSITSKTCIERSREHLACRFFLIASIIFGITSKASLVKARPYLIVLFLVIGMLLTPPDVFSQLSLAIPMWALFEIGILFSKEK